MFRFFSLLNSSRLSELLSQQNPDLEEILDEECVVNEVRNCNQQLVKHFCRKDIFDALVSYVIEIPTNMNYEPNESKRTDKINKYPYVACEVLAAENDTLAQFFLGLISDEKLRDIDTETIPDDVDFDRADSMNIEHNKDATSDTNGLIDNLNEDTQMEIEFVTPIRRFLRVLNSKVPLNLTIAGYFTKIMKSLFGFKPEHMSILLFDTHFKYMFRMTRHLNSDSILELFTLIIKLDTQYFRVDAKEFYIEKRIQLIQQVILNIFQKPTPDYDDNAYIDLRINCANLLANLLANLENFVSSHDILSPLFQPEVLNKVCIEGIKNEELIEPLTPLIIQLCEYHGHVFAPKNETPQLDLSNYTEPVSQSEVPEGEPFLNALLNSIESISGILNLENHQFQPHEVPFQYGGTSFMFGKSRLSILELVHSILKLQNEKVSIQIINCNLLSVLLHLFVRNPWSNIIHATLSRIIKLIMLHGPESLLLALFQQAKILDFIIDATKHSEITLNSKGGRKVNMAYTAYLYSLANFIEDSNVPFVKEFCEGHQGWQMFKTTQLREVNDRNNMKIGGDDPHSQTTSFSGFPRVTLYNGEVIGTQNDPVEDNDELTREIQGEEIKLDSDIMVLRNEEEGHSYVPTYEYKDGIEASPTNHGEFLESDIEERHASEMNYPHSVEIKTLMTNNSMSGDQYTNYNEEDTTNVQENGMQSNEENGDHE